MFVNLSIERMARSKINVSGSERKAASSLAATGKAVTVKSGTSKAGTSKATSQDDGVAFGSRIIKKKNRQTKSRRAGLVFPVGRVQRKLRKGNYADRVGAGKNTWFICRP